MRSPDDSPGSRPPLLVALIGHYDELVGYIRRRFGDRGFAREVVHDVCVKIMERPASAEVVQAPLALLRRISHDAAVDRCRAEDARRAWIDAVDTLPETACPAPDQLRVLSARQELELLVQVIDALPKRRRQVFVLHKIHELPQAEVAARMGISIKMVEKQLRLAMVACRERLEREARLHAG